MTTPLADQFKQINERLKQIERETTAEKVSTPPPPEPAAAPAITYGDYGCVPQPPWGYDGGFCG